MSALPPSPIEPLTPFIIAVTVTGPLLGIAISQGSAYYRDYPKDSIFMKILVGVCLALNVAQFATLCFTNYFWMITCRVEPNYGFLQTLSKSLIVVPPYITYFLATVVQLFYAMRVWFVSDKNIWLVGVIVALSFTHLVGGYALVSYMVTQNTLVSVYSEFNHISGGFELGASILCDILITVSLVYYLRKSKPRVFHKTRGAIDKLVLYSINLGVLTNIAVILNLTIWAASPSSDFKWAVFHLSLGKIYVNSMLVSLNARKKIRNEMLTGTYVAPVSTFDAFHDMQSGTTTKTSQIPLKDIPTNF